MNASVKYLVLLTTIFAACKPATTEQHAGAEREKVTFEEHLAEKRIDVLVDGKLFTAYRWPDKVYKPVLFPIISSAGTTITRGFPLEPRENERNDHRHQVGNWLNYGNVNGFDFWGNGHSGERLPKGGEIRHLSIDKKSEGEGEAVLLTRGSWLDPSGNELLSEKTVFHFIARDSLRIIDRITTLKSSSSQAVTFSDTKEGMFGLRVARQLELPSEGEVLLTDASGNASAEKQPNTGVTGNYRSSEGITGEKVWSTRARWMNLYGSIDDKHVSVMIFDHPKNLSYPTWWHARGYGLFSANPLGAKDFTKGKEQLNFSLPSGDSVTFRYRIAVSSGADLPDAKINELADEFAEKY